MWPLLAGHKNTDIFIRLSYYSRVDNAFQLEVCFSMYILISYCNTFLSWRAGICSYLFKICQRTWRIYISCNEHETTSYRDHDHAPYKKYMSFHEHTKKQTNVGVAFIRITRFHYRNINHVYQLNYCLSYFGLYFGYQRLISTWLWEARKIHDHILIKETSTIHHLTWCWS